MSRQLDVQLMSTSGFEHIRLLAALPSMPTGQSAPELVMVTAGWKRGRAVSKRSRQVRQSEESWAHVRDNGIDGSKPASSRGFIGLKV